MSYAGFRFTGGGAVLQRPADRVPAIEGDTWARDRAQGAAGAELDATFLNRLKANLEAFVVACGGNLNDGDAQLANAINAALALKSSIDHDHNDAYYLKAQVDELLATLVPIAGIVDNLTTNDATKPLSAKQGKLLQDQINGLGDGIVVADMAAAGALTGLDQGDVVHILNNGSGKWVRYEVVAAGNGTWAGCTKVVIFTQDQAPASHGHLASDITDSGTIGRQILQAATAAATKALLAIAIADVSGLQAALDLKAPLASPALTGNPTAPTQAAGNNSTRLANTAFVQAAIAAVDGALAGDLHIGFDATPKAGFLELNGATISGGAATYPGIAARYPWMVSSGNIILPDTRGEFLRGWDHGRGKDPDAASRLGRAGDGSTGNNPGTRQADELKSHFHSVPNISSGAGEDWATSGTSRKRADSVSGATGGNETRPTNLYVMFQMKAG